MKFLIAIVAILPFVTFAQNSETIKIHKSEIEAVQDQDGSYARYADISEGFVNIPGVSTSKDSFLIDLKKSNLNTIILQDGSHFNQAILNAAAVVIGGDMGGGGTAH